MPEHYTSPRSVSGRTNDRRLHTISPVYQLIPYIMRHPSDAVISFTDQADTAAMERWLRQKQNEGHEDLSIIHIFIAAYVRMVAHRPAMNRYISGRFLYARDTIDAVLSTGRDGNGAADAGALTVKVRLLPTDTIYDVSRKLNTQMDKIKAEEDANRIENLAITLIKTPRFVLRGGLSVLRWLEYHGLLGDRWTGRSPFHGSVVISDEGAASLPPVTRSINSIGNIPLSISIGRRRTVTELNRTGQLVQRRYVDYAVSVDSRIADSMYMGSAFKYFRYFLSNPEELETPPEHVNEDIM